MVQPQADSGEHCYSPSYGGDTITPVKIVALSAPARSPTGGRNPTLGSGLPSVVFAWVGFLFELQFALNVTEVEV